MTKIKIPINSMHASGNQPVTSIDGQERLSRKALHPFCLASFILPHKSAKPYLCLTALMLFCLLSAAPAIAADITYWTPWVTDLTTSSATINWLGVEVADGKYLVEYATKKHYDDHKDFPAKIESPAQGTFQHVLIAGLEPNTSYVYQVTPPVPPDSVVVFPIGNFKTMPVSGPFTFLVISDSHAQEERFKHLAHAIAKHETDALFILDGGDYASYDLEDAWRFYFNDNNVGEMFAKFPIFHAVGNHEYHQKDLNGPPTQAVLYHDAFDILEGKPLNYSFDCAGIRFIFLSSPDPSDAKGTKPDTPGTDPQTTLVLAQSQVPWLKGQSDNNMAGTFTIHHHPKWYCHEKQQNKDELASYEIMDNPDLQPWQELYQQYGISANFSGHVHNYQRFSVKGVPYFIVGNGGGLFNTLGIPLHPDVRGASYQFGETLELGYLKIMVDPENNTATAQEIFVATVSGENQETITPHDPKIADEVTFQLSSKRSILTITKSGDGSGTVASYPPYEIYCDSSSSTSNTIFKKKEKVVLMAIPDAGSTFIGWKGDCKSHGQQQQCYVTVRPNKDITVEAVFEKVSPSPISPSANTIPFRTGNR
jgi:hypothetical protein